MPVVTRFARLRLMKKVKSNIERFEKYVKRSGSCWLWQGHVNSRNHYGYFTVRCSGHYLSVLAHRWSYSHFVGHIPQGHDLDHLCRNRRCVNPDHLEPVTRRENLLRGIGVITIENSKKTHCPKGHPYDAANTGFSSGRRGRRCLACHRDKERARRYHAAKYALAELTAGGN